MGDVRQLTREEFEQIAKSPLKFKEDMTSEAGDLLMPFFMSQEPLRQPTDDDGLTYIVGRQWDQIVYDHSKDIFVMHYSKKNENIAGIIRIWIQLALYTREIEDLIIAVF